MKMNLGMAWAALLLCLGPGVRASDGNAPGAADFSAEGLFSRGRYEAALNNGVLFSPFLATKNRPAIDYTLSEVQLGYMLGGVKGTGWWRGNFEVVGEGFGSGIYEGPGSYIAGATVWLRYNFVRPTCRLVPYVQAGAGLTSTDIDRGLVGEPFNFNLELGVGVRYFLSERWALALEYRYQHISNANIGAENVGINAQGPILGVSFLF